MKHLFSFLLVNIVLLLVKGVEAQDSLVNIRFEITLNNQPLQLGKPTYIDQLKDSVTIYKLQFYVSNLSLQDSNSKLRISNIPAQLIDPSKPETLNFKLKTLPQFSSVRFNLGVDSITNSNGAHGGDLDPINGMYWTWQSGYINVKLEGSSQICPTRGNAFQYHLGGYSVPYNALQIVTLNVLPVSEIVIQLTLDSLFTERNLKENNHIMSPSNNAVQLSQEIKTLFSVK